MRGVRVQARGERGDPSVLHGHTVAPVDEDADRFQIRRRPVATALARTGQDVAVQVDRHAVGHHDEGFFGTGQIVREDEIGADALPASHRRLRGALAGRRRRRGRQRGRWRSRSRGRRRRRSRLAGGKEGGHEEREAAHIARTTRKPTLPFPCRLTAKPRRHPTVDRARITGEARHIDLLHAAEWGARWVAPFVRPAGGRECVRCGSWRTISSTDRWRPRLARCAIER